MKGTEQRYTYCIIELEDDLFFQPLKRDCSGKWWNMAQRPQLQRGQSGISVGAYSRKDGDDLEQAVYALAGPLFLMFLASSIQAAAAINFCSNVALDCSDLNGFSVALGVVSGSLLLLFFLVFAVESWRERIPDKSLLYLAGGLLVWWSVGVAFTTFQITIVPDTRYFASWASLIFAALVAHSEFDQFSQLVSDIRALERHSQATFYLLLASIVETAAAVFPCVDVGCGGLEIYAIIAGALSIVVCLILLRVSSSKLGMFGNVMAIYLVIWWTLGLGILTLSGPFLIGGNGFFACWCGFLLSFFVAQGKIFPQSENFGGNNDNAVNNRA